jgi:hypothetical protein
MGFIGTSRRAHKKTRLTAVEEHQPGEGERAKVKTMFTAPEGAGRFQKTRLTAVEEHQPGEGERAKVKTASAGTRPAGIFTFQGPS